MPQTHYSQEFEQYIQEHNDTTVNAYQEQRADTIRSLITNQIDKQMNEFNPLYDDNTPIPGADFEVEKTYSGKTLKEEAESELIAGAAIRKARAERAAELKRPLEERIKETYIDACMRQISNEFFDKHGRSMSGSEKRMMRRKIEQGYGKKKTYTPNRKQREDIIDYLNMPSSDTSNQRKEAQPTQMSSARAVSSLLSSI